MVEFVEFVELDVALCFLKVADNQALSNTAWAQGCLARWTGGHVFCGNGIQFEVREM